MKYTDEEMAEAALLLSHTDTSKDLPTALQATLLDRGNVVAGEMRFSTTKAGVVEIDAPTAPVIPIGRAARSGQYAGWLAAAACFAFAVYEWRARAVDGAHTASQPAEAAPSKLLDANGQAVAEVAADATHFKVLHLPAKAGQRYQIWTTTTDAAHAVAMGSFSCEPPGCDGRELGLAPGPTRPTRAWITTVNGTEAGRPTDSSAIIGTGGISGGNAP